MYKHVHLVRQLLTYQQMNGFNMLLKYLSSSILELPNDFLLENPANICT